MRDEIGMMNDNFKNFELTALIDRLFVEAIAALDVDDHATIARIDCIMEAALNDVENFIPRGQA